MPRYSAFFSVKLLKIMPPYFRIAYFRIALPTCLLALTASGCSPPESIRRYEVLKPALTDRMLAAIVPHGDRAWFFKVSGKDVALEPLTEAFVEMVRS